jgi:hypothetical protein
MATYTVVLAKLVRTVSEVEADSIEEATEIVQENVSDAGIVVIEENIYEQRIISVTMYDEGGAVIDKWVSGDYSSFKAPHN